MAAAAEQISIEGRAAELGFRLENRDRKTINASWSTILWSTILWTKNNALYLQKIKNYGQTICIRDRRLWRELYR